MAGIIAPGWADAPAITRLLCVGAPVLSLVFTVMYHCGATWPAENIFWCNLYTFKQLHIWSLFLSPFVTVLFGHSVLGPIMVILVAFFALQEFPTREKQLGSTLFLVWMFFINVAANIVHLAMMWFLTQAFPDSDWTWHKVQNLWAPWIVVSTLNCMSDPNGAVNYCGLVSIPKKYYTVFFTSLWSLINFSILWDLLAGLLIGYAYHFCRMDRFLPSNVRISVLEQRCCGGRQIRIFRASWVTAASAPPSALTENPTPTAAGPSSFAPFQGGGNRLGGLGTPENPLHEQEMAAVTSPQPAVTAAAPARSILPRVEGVIVSDEEAPAPQAGGPQKPPGEA